MTKKIAVSIKGVSKNFKLPHERSQTLKRSFLNLFSSSARKYDVQHALRDINLQIEAGEFFGIVGRNGSGKSTLLKILAGIYQPSQGHVEVEGKLVPFIELGVGFNQELTGRENIFLNGALLGFSRTQIESMYADIVAFAELEEFMDQKLKNYSSGMQVRLAFSLASRSQSDVLLIDEVLAVGDADFQRKCFAYFKQLKKTGTTVIFVTHDMDAVREYCTRAALIDGSRIAAIGSADEIATRYTQLFMAPTSDGAVATVGGKRWGDGRLKYQSVSAKHVIETDRLEIRVLAHAELAVSKPVFGFLIKNAAGQPLFGTNTRLKRRSAGDIGAGEQIELVWSVPYIFSEGTHSVELAIEDDVLVVCDWWEEAAMFNVQRESRSPYLLDPTVELELNRS